MPTDKVFKRDPEGKIITDKPTLWHCHGSRSLRSLWALEESGIDYDVVNMQFPPRINEPDYKAMNVLGTVPYFIDGEQRLSESSGICLYLVERYKLDSLRIQSNHPAYGDYLNWLFMSDATLTFPQTLVLRYSLFEPQERQSPQVAQDYAQWFVARLKRLDQHLVGRDYLCDNRFTIADIAVGYALYLGQVNNLHGDYSSAISDYVARLTARAAFKCVLPVGEELSPFVHPELWT
ncbi:MAG: glutathione S-transferase family protein, partial [Pseudomonadales bacterium]|nr:glutathione S-transferase family protein [Pseudomonadales bacterium]